MVKLLLRTPGAMTDVVSYETLEHVSILTATFNGLH